MSIEDVALDAQKLERRRGFNRHIVFYLVTEEILFVRHQSKRKPDH